MALSGNPVVLGNLGSFTAGGGVITPGIAVTQVAYGSATNQIKGEAAFTYTEGSNTLTVDNVTSNAATALVLSAAGGAGNINVEVRPSGTGVGVITQTPSSTNTLSVIAQFNRMTSGTAANNIGGTFQFLAEDDAGAAREAGVMSWRLTSAAAASPTGQLILGSRGANTALVIAHSGNTLLGGLTTDGTGQLQLAGGTTDAHAVAFGTDTYLYRVAANNLVLKGTSTGDVGLNIQRTGGTASSWTLYSPSGANSFIIRGGSGPTDVLTMDASANSTFAGNLSKGGSNGQLSSIKQLTELTTIAAAGTTATAIQIPANAIVIGVSVRVTVVVPDAANFTVTGTTSSTAFQTGANVSTAATTTDAGTKNCPFLNTTAQTITFTFDTPPLTDTGRIRVTIHYIEITPATS